MANTVYNQFKADIANGTQDFDDGAATYKVLLASTSYTPDPDHAFVSDITNELSGGNYARATLTGRAVSQDNTNDRVDLKGDNITFTNLTGSPRYAVVYKFITNDAASRLVCCIDLTAQSLSSVDFTIKWDGQTSNGSIVRLS